MKIEILLDAMNEAEAKEFESEIISFGTHFGKRYYDVPKEYLECLSKEYLERLSDTEIRLIRYTKSERFKQMED